MFAKDAALLTVVNNPNYKKVLTKIKVAAENGLVSTEVDITTFRGQADTVVDIFEKLGYECKLYNCPKTKLVIRWSYSLNTQSTY